MAFTLTEATRKMFVQKLASLLGLVLLAQVIALAPGDTATITCANRLTITSQSNKQISVKCANDVTATPTRTATLTLTPTSTQTPTRTPTPSVPTATPIPGLIWSPAIGTQWQWQLTTPVDQSVNVPAYDIDGFDNSASVVAALHVQGRKVICYLDIGGWENYRPDAASYPASVLGATVGGWPDERWIDIRQIDVLAPIIGARLDMCKSKGFDAVEPDMIEAYSNNSGFPLTANDQLVFNKWIAAQIHSRGMSAVLKGDVEQVTALEPYFDFALNEECFTYNECGAYSTSFIAHGKAVFQVEYSLATSKFCSQANALNFNSMKKRLNLNAWREPCQ